MEDGRSYTKTRPKQRLQHNNDFKGKQKEKEGVRLKKKKKQAGWKSWGEVNTTAGKREKWKILWAEASCDTRHEEDR